MLQTIAFFSRLINDFHQNKNLGLIRVIQKYFLPSITSKGLIFGLHNYLIADMIYVITEQCMDIEWARCEELIAHFSASQ